MAESPPPMPNSSEIDHPELWGAISEREREVLRLFLKDPNDKKIARALHTAVQTIRNQIYSIKQKLGVESREQLILLMLSRPK